MEVETICPVCYEEVTEDTFKKLVCLHILCYVCLRRLRNPSCPLCRTTIDTSYREQLIPPAGEISWELIDDLDFEFSVEINIHNQSNIRRHRRRNRQRRRLRERERQSQIPSQYISEEVIQELEAIIFVPRRGNIKSRVIMNDSDRQKCRTARNRWFQNQSYSRWVKSR